MRALRVRPVGGISGQIQAPPDKSISHRAVLFSAMAEGLSVIEDALDGEDVQATLAMIRAAGIRAEGALGLGQRLEIQGGPWQDMGRVDCGNSGTTARLLLGALAGRASAALDGDASLRRRPMGRVLEPLRAMGAQIEGNSLPLQIKRSRLSGLTWRAKVASAQVKSALLLAGLHAQQGVTYTEALPTRDHSERFLQAMGANITVEQGAERVIRVGPSVLSPIHLRVPGDISSAAFWLVAASVVPDSDMQIVHVGLNPTRHAVLGVLKRMGADISLLDVQEGLEPTATLRVRAAALRATEVGGAEVPFLIDEIPILAVAAAFAEGSTVFRDAAELRVKESDRIASTLAGLQALGIVAEERPDGLVVHGNPNLRGQEAIIHSQGDHRIAMAFAVAGLRVGTWVQDVDCIATSYPGFFDTLAQFGGVV